MGEPKYVKKTPKNELMLASYELWELVSGIDGEVTEEQRLAAAKAEDKLCKAAVKYAESREGTN